MGAGAKNPNFQHQKPTACLAFDTHVICSDPCKAGSVDVELLGIDKPKPRSPDGRWSWVVCFACFLSNLIICGFTYSYGLLFPVLLEEFKEGKAKTAWLGSLVILSVGLYGPVAGKLNDRFSSRSVAMFGGLLCAAGTGASSQAPDLDILFVTYGIVFGFGACFVYVSLYLVVPRYFIRRRSLALGILSMGPGAGLFLISPLIRILMEHYSWRGTFLVGSAAMLGLCFLAMTFDPNVAEVDQEEKTKILDDPSAMKSQSTIASLLQNRTFIVYTVGSAMAYYGHYVSVVHMVRHCEDFGISDSEASKLYLNSGLASLIMRPLVGRLCDVTRITPGFVLQVATFGSGVAALLLPLATRYVHFVAYFVVYGIMDGSMGTGNALAVLNCLSAADRSLGFGIMQSAACVAGMIGPVAAGFLADQFGSYNPAFYMSGASAVLAAATMSLVYCTKKAGAKYGSSLETSQDQLIIVDKVSVV